MLDYKEFESLIKKSLDPITGKYNGGEQIPADIKKQATMLCRYYFENNLYYFDNDNQLSSNDKTKEFIKIINDDTVVRNFIDETLQNDYFLKVDLHNKGQEYRPFEIAYVYNRDYRKQPSDRYILNNKIYLKLGIKENKMCVTIHYSLENKGLKGFACVYPSNT